MLDQPDPSTVDRLGKIAARLASDFDGERANAAALASRLLADCGVTWEQLVVRAFQAPQPPVGAAHVAQAMWAARFSDRLDEWERGFLSSIARRPRLTPKQAAVLAGILRKLGRSTP